MMTRIAVAVLSAVLVSLAGAVAHAHEVVYTGTVVTVEVARFEVDVIDEDTKIRNGTVMTFTVTDTTKVLRGDTRVSFADAHIQKDERVAVIVDHDDGGSEALEIRLAGRDPE